MSEKVERVLVQGTVKFEVSCNDLMGLVEPDIADNEYKLKEWLQDKAFKNIDLASVDVEIDNIDTVHITKSTSDQHTNQIIGNNEWKKIMNENKQND